MKILVASDLHISEKIWQHKPITGDSYYSWKQIVQIGCDNNVDAVILAGDLLDKQSNTSGPIQQFTEGLRIFIEAEIPVYFNQGQHEFQENPWAKLVPRCVHLHKKSFKRDGVEIYGLDFQATEKLHEELKQIPKTASVLVAHQVWADFMGDIAKPQAAFSDIPEHITTLITGDYHVSSAKKHGKRLVISPGSSHLRSISEPVDKFCYLLELPSQKVTEVPLRTRRCIEFETKYKSQQAIVEQLTQEIDNAYEYAATHKLPESLVRPLVRITHDIADKEIQRQLTSLLGERVHFFWKCVNERAKLDGEDQAAELSEARVTMADCLDEFVDPEEEPVVFNLAERLLQSDEPAAELGRWVDSSLDNSSVS